MGPLVIAVATSIPPMPIRPALFVLIKPLNWRDKRSKLGLYITYAPTTPQHMRHQLFSWGPIPRVRRRTRGTADQARAPRTAFPEARTNGAADAIPPAKREPHASGAAPVTPPSAGPGFARAARHKCDPKRETKGNRKEANPNHSNIKFCLT